MQRILLALLITAAVLALWLLLTLPVHALRATRGLLPARPAPVRARSRSLTRAPTLPDPDRASAPGTAR
ncbi:hypothetical protein AU375_05440 [Methylobacterium radiotolerans]|nr:hypothetical protein AU375_05440 [Methylobacterium radiotolerans]